MNLSHLGHDGKDSPSIPRARSMQLTNKMVTWLETHYASPAYAGWVLVGLTMCFWIAAANTMAGWLYVLSGISVALLLLSAWLPRQNLKRIKITRSSTLPVHVGEYFSQSLTLYNPTSQVKGMLLIQDGIPPVLGTPIQSVIEEIPPQQTYTWQYQREAHQRGLYQWKTITLRTAAPFGLLWSRKTQKVAAEMLIYPQILPLNRCPLIDELSASAQQQQQIPIARTGQEGATRSLRPYRWGDPMRMVHWKSSARFNEMRVRELEHLSGGYAFTIALDTHGPWLPSQFEQAVIATASLFSYALQHYGSAQLWSEDNRLIQNWSQALTLLATIRPQPPGLLRMPTQAIIWLTANPGSIAQLAQGSRYLLWGSSTQHPNIPGLCLSDNTPLQVQIQQDLVSASKF